MNLQMMQNLKIIKIQGQVRRPNRKTIFLDNGDVFGITEDVLISNNLVEGQTISETEIEKIKFDESNNKALNAAYRLLSYRMRSESEMKNRLKQKDYDKNIITAVIEYLKTINYLNDEEFAIAFARDKINSKQIGPIALRQEFIQHYLSKELIDETINKVYEEFPVSELILRNIKKSMRDQKWQNDPQKTQRVIAMLKRKGFSWDDITTLIE